MANESSRVPSVPKGKRFSKAEKSWMFYDWANSVYATNIMAAIMPIYFAQIASSQGESGSIMWGYATSLATLIIALLAPFLGAIGDYKGAKKKMFTLFLVLGVTFTASMAIFDQWQMMLVGYVISYIGFTGSNLFYDSFLTDVTTPGRMDKISSYAYAIGYIGGSTIPFIASIGILLLLGMDNPLAVKLAVVLTCVWWAVFSIPMLKNVKQNYYIQIPAQRLVKNTLNNIWHTLRAIVKNTGLLIFIIAYFFYIDGVNTVIHMATSYGTDLGLDTTGMILALLVTQLVAVPFSILFGILAKRAGAMRMIFIAVVVYTFICVVGYYMGYMVERAQLDGVHADLAISRAQTLFWFMAILVGTVQGGIQALSRSYFGKLIPPNRSNEFFGFFDIFGKFAAVSGPFLYAFISQMTGSNALGILSVSSLFVVALVILIAGRRQLKETESKAHVWRETEPALAGSEVDA